MVDKKHVYEGVVALYLVKNAISRFLLGVIADEEFRMIKLCGTRIQTLKCNLVTPCANPITPTPHLFGMLSCHHVNLSLWFLYI